MDGDVGDGALTHRAFGYLVDTGAVCMLALARERSG
jgi:hypothetical protein